MNVYENEIRSYQALNRLAEGGGTVIFGGSEDREIPVCELARSFELKSALYNRSLDGLTLGAAVDAYDACVAPLSPERVLLHLGEADPAAFARDYRALIAHIRALDRRCEIHVVSLKNPEALPQIAGLNRELKNLADSERCGFADISVKHVWNPAAMKETVSFLYSTGFVRPLRAAMPVYDLVRVLYGYDAACVPAQEPAVKAAGRVKSRMGMPKASYV